MSECEAPKPQTEEENQQQMKNGKDTNADNDYGHYMLCAAPNWYQSGVLACSSDFLLAYGANNTVTVMDISLNGSRRILKEFGWRRIQDRVSAVDFGMIGGEEILASGDLSGKILCWNARMQESGDKAKYSSFSCDIQHKKNISAICIAEGVIVTGDYFGTVICWDPQTNKVIGAKRRGVRVNAIKANPMDPKIVAIGFYGGALSFMNVRTANYTRSLAGHDSDVLALCWSLPGKLSDLCVDLGNELPDGADSDQVTSFLASASRDMRIIIWNTDDVIQKQLYHPRKKKEGGHDEMERQWITLVWPSPQVFLSAGFTGEIFSWDLSSAVCKKYRQRHNRIVFSMAFSPAVPSRVYSVSQNRDIKAWDVLLEKNEWSLDCLAGYVHDIDLPKWDSGEKQNELAILGVGDKTLRVWSLPCEGQTRDWYKNRTIWRGIQGKVTAIRCHPTLQGWVAIGGDGGRISCINVYTNSILRCQTCHGRSVFEIVWIPASEVPDGDEVPPEAPGIIVEASELTEEWALLSSGGGQVMYTDLRGLLRKKTLKEFILEANPEHQERLEDYFPPKIKPTERRGMRRKKFLEVAYCDRSGRIALGVSDGSILIFNTSWKLLMRLQDQLKDIYRIRFHPGGSDNEVSPFQAYLASGSEDRSIVVYDLDAQGTDPFSPGKKGKLTLLGHRGAIYDLGWNPFNGKILASCGQDTTVQI